AIPANAQGGRLVQTVLFMQTPALAVVVANQFKDIRDIKDFSKLTIGVLALGTTSDFAVRALFKQNGLDPNTAKVVAVGTGAAAVAALTSGRVQAEVTVDPIATTMVQQGHGVALKQYDMRTVSGTKVVFGGAFPGAGLVATQEGLAKNRASIAA